MACLVANHDAMKPVSRDAGGVTQHFKYQSPTMLNSVSPLSFSLSWSSPKTTMILDNLSLSNTWVVVALSAVLLVLSRFAAPTVDENEPPIIKPRVPFIGHIITMLRDGSDIYVNLL